MANFQITNLNQEVDSLVKEVNKKTAKIKAQYPGVKNALLLICLYRLTTRKIFEKIIKKEAINLVKAASTNLGILEEDRMRFDTLSIKDAYITTPIRNKSGIALAFSTFNNTITMSISGRYSEAGHKKVEELFDNFDETINHLLMF